MTGDVRSNSRALRQLRSFSSLGWNVHVLAFDGDAAPDIDLPGVTFEILAQPESSGPLYFWNVHRTISRKVRTLSAIVYHASDLYVLPALAASARRQDARLVYDARELYTHVASTIGRPWVRWFWRWVEQSGIRRADLVLTVSDGIAHRLVEMYSIPRPTVLMNVPDMPKPEIHRTLKLFSDVSMTKTLILHQGQMRRHRGCELLVDAMRDVEGAVLVFLGDGPLRPKLEALAATARVSGRVRFMDPVPPDELLAFTASADIGVTLLDDSCLNHVLALPNKLFEYLAARVPVIASDLPEIRKVVATYNVGEVIEPGNRRDLVAALNQAVLDKSLRERWRRNIPEALETFNWEQASQEFLKAYQELVSEAQ